MTGIVKFWNPAGWGIVTPHGVKFGDKEREVFIHENKLPDGISKLSEGQEVEYSLFPDIKPPRALTVKLLGKQAYVPINSQRKAVASGD
jgi:cold shock CspA family protein